MKQTILIHGRPDENEFNDPSIHSPSNAHWFPWLQKQLAMRGEVCQSLEFPFQNQEPVYEDWVSVIENFKINSETNLIGHSTGGGFILRYLSEHPELKPQKVILVAPWLDPDHELTTEFFDFEIDSKLPERTSLHIFMSSDDDEWLLKSFEIIKEKLSNATYHEFTDKGHFCEKDFPEILEVLT